MSYAIERSSGMYRGHWPNPRTGKVVPHFTWHKMDMVKKFDTEESARRCIRERGMKGCKVTPFKAGMMKQSGFVQLSMLAWVAIAAGAVIACLTGAVYVQTLRLNAEKADFATFKGGVEALGEAAKRKAADQEMADKLNKETADAQHAKAVASLNADIARLRNANPSRSRLPEAPVSSGRPDLACFDRAEYQRADGAAIEKLFAGARGLADEGTAATVDLDTVKDWGRHLKAM